MTTVLRESLMKNLPDVVDGFRMRGRDVSRLESFSDAVFAFALTLLVVSLDVPRTVTDLFDAMRGFPAFALCFLFLALIWNAHYKFCRRFGLHDGGTRALTCLMLFLVLFYSYPLKFLFNLSISSLIFGSAAHNAPMTRPQFSALMVVYDLGFAAVYGALILLYLRAYKFRDELDLNELEKFDTRWQIYRYLALVVVGVLAAALSQVPWVFQWSGLAFALLFPLMRILKTVQRRRRMAHLVG